MAPRSKLHQYTKIFREHPVQIFVGSSKKPYFVHPGALSWCNTSALNARINGPWRENGANEPIDWTDFDERTVECVLSYLYTQDYHVPSSESEPNSICENADGASATIGVESLANDAESSTSSPVLADELEFNRPLTPLSRCLRVGLPPETIQTAAGGLTQRTLQDCDNNLAEEILIHAKVYCFAHRFLISDLETFALQRLTQVLLTIDAQNDTLFPYLADAIRFVYDSTPSAQLQDNQARKLLSQYVGLKYTILANKNLTQLLEEGGEFMTDLSHKLSRRLAVSETGAQSLEEQIDELQTRLNELEASYQDKESQLQSVRGELAEWESWNRGISGKFRKARRNGG
ncbi:hypothetical protein BDV23DRAFT_186525 [Aspergillus alliaceus]|uniref:BTB domain-containing protein n=1 Tax=Petromyces alliaceus TaxID=209559 RepID=A0A5N7BZL0_PETAA|nr:hypothetical protein BDV23DRAFT_186525 [Aspergillus alliaceus]